MPITLSARNALIVIDVQNGFKLEPYRDMEVFPDLDTVIGNMRATIEAFRTASIPIIHVHHASLEESSLNPVLSPEGYAVLPDAAPIGDEVVFVKHVNSGFIGTGLEAHLRAEQIETLVIIGLTTSHCVSTTTRMAGNLGWAVYVARDGTAMFERPAAPGTHKHFDAETMHEVALAELHDEFATVLTTEEILRGVKDFV
ncbi:isochorismatase family protein [Mycena alexandri]|uniref:Isochorismatase family protein n=1 Tax=Mycena alexandri TaxID=1745969 RepID=A0AAD6TA51_9AGAR|nr:isochorismatase family protein [Mycena alexandri]